jgi:hypothetical protein
LYSLENHLLSIKGELLHEIGMDRRRDYHRERETIGRLSSSTSRNILASLRHDDEDDDDDDEVEEMIQEGKRWRHFEVSLLDVTVADLRVDWRNLCC